MTRLCPECIHPLKRSTEGEVEIDSCARCAGVWLDPGELRKLVGAGAGALDAALVPEVTPPDATTPGRLCPDCLCRLEKHKYLYDSSIVLDSCPMCRGVWVEDGELQQIDVWTPQDDLKGKDEAYRAMDRANDQIAHERSKGTERWRSRFWAGVPISPLVSSLLEVPKRRPAFASTSRDRPTSIRAKLESEPTSTHLVLASASPRRAELLRLLGLPFEVFVSEYSEPPPNGQSPGEYALKMAAAKAADVAAKVTEEAPNRTVLVLGADTVVALTLGEMTAIFGKPTDKADALRMLTELSGRTHSVFTGVALIRVNRDSPKCDLVGSLVEETTVTFGSVHPDALAAYVESDEPMDKAGAYGIQERAAAFISSIEGDYSNVVGLPVCAVGKLLEKAGVQWWLGAHALRL